MARRSRRLHITLGLALALSSILTLSLGWQVGSAKAADPSVQPYYFKESGYWLEPDFRTYFEQHGGLAQFGLPITDEFREINPADGKAYSVQYFERARLEYHPEFKGTAYEVELGLLGRQVTTSQNFQPTTDTTSTATRSYFPETKHAVADKFKAYWEANGGLSIYGFPISEPFSEVNPSDGKTYTVQYFERNRFELHPEFAGTKYEVELGLLAVQVLTGQGWKDLGTEWAFRPPAETQNAGMLGQNSAILPNGRVVTPAGTVTKAGQLSLGLNLTPDGKRLLVSNSGYGQETISTLDSSNLNKISDTNENLLFGSGVIDTKRNVIYYPAPGKVKNAWADAIIVHSLNGGQDSSIRLGDGDYPVGVALSLDANTLYVVNNMTNSLVTLDMTTPTPTIKSRVKVGNFPYAVTMSPDGSRLYVTNWGIYNYSAVKPGTPQPTATPPAGQDPQGGSSVWVMNTSDLSVVSKISVGIQPGQESTQAANPVAQGGSHPTAMLFSKDSKTLYVADANNDAVSVIDVASNTEKNRINLLPFKGSQFSSYPSALTLSPDGNTLYVAMSGLNAVDVVDVSPQANKAQPLKGMIPTGWYPSSVALSPDGKNLYVASAKGYGAGPIDASKVYILGLIVGTVQSVDLTKEDLNKDSNMVMMNNGYVRTDLPQSSQTNPIPAHPGQTSPIKHVIYITRENRTYDQVFGDLGRGNGDPKNLEFGQNVTPNLHQMAQQYSFSDNFYADGETSNPGHQWLTAGNVTDFTEKTMPFIYSGRRPGFKNEDPEDYTVVGYLFNNLNQHNMSWYDYGDLIRVDGYAPDYTGQNPLDYDSPTPGLGATWNLNVPIPQVLNGHYDPKYPGWNLKITDTRRAKEFLSQFNATGYDLPQMTYIWLPNDHTPGTDGGSPGFPTRATSVADNDQATGMIIDAISHSKYWDSTAIFITEDDAQDGSDHVDAHRTVNMVISPYVKQGYISHEHYSQASMLKTMELILGLPAMSQYDGSALPMWDIFQSSPNMSNTYSMIAQKVTPQLQTAPAKPASTQNLNSPKFDLSKPDTLDQDGDGDGY